MKHCRTYLYGCLSEGLQPLSAALLHVDHIPVVSLQCPLQTVHCLEHQVLALIQLFLKNLQSVNLKADRKTVVSHKGKRNMGHALLLKPANLLLHFETHQKANVSSLDMDVRTVQL